MPLKQTIAFHPERVTILPKPQYEALQPTLRKRSEKLARSGECKSVVEIRHRLKSEGYSSTSVDGYLEENPAKADLIGILSAAERDPAASFFTCGSKDIG